MKKYSYLIPSAKIVSFFIFLLCLFLIQQSYQIGYTTGMEHSLKVSATQPYPNLAVVPQTKCSWDFINSMCRGLHD